MMEKVRMETLLLRPDIIVKNEHDNYTVQLFSLLDKRECDKFIKTIKKLSSTSAEMPNLNCGNGLYTYLQYACRNGLENVVKCLLDNGANINCVCNEYTYPPIMEAGCLGRLNIIKLIVDGGDSDQLVTRNKKGSNIVHSIIMGVLTDNGENVVNMVNCLKYVLRKLKEKYKYCYKNIVNEVDEVMGTPLHYVASTGNRQVIMELLQSGASIVRKDKGGNFAFSELNKDILEEFLNTRMRHEYHAAIWTHSLTFNYDFLAPKDENTSEAEPLKHMSRSPDFRQLLKHPVFTAYIDHKWQKISDLYKYIAWFYIILVSCITAYVLLPGNTTEVEEDSLLSDVSQLLQICIACYLVMLSLVEVWQAVVLRWEYLHSLENWVDILLIATTSVMISQKITRFQQEISAVVIFLAWTDILLLLGRHPSCSKRVEMYKRVTFTFLEFLSCYSIFVFAFVLSFYILSQSPKPDVSAFQNLSMTVFNVTLSLAGTLGPEYTPYDNHPVIGHLLFLTFVVLICINLLNLLNGLAVSDTREILEEAELVGFDSRVKFIFLIEKMADPRLKMSISSVNIFGKTKLLQDDYELKFLRKKVNDHYNWTHLVETIDDKGNGCKTVSSKVGPMTLLEPIAKAALEILNKDDKLAEITEKVDSLVNQFSDINVKVLSQDLKKILSRLEKMDLKQGDENKFN